MATKIFATKDYKDTSVSTEASSRITEDNTISADLSVNSTEISDATLLVTNLNNDITTETNERLAFVDGTINYGTLTNEDDTNVSNMSQGIKALHLKQLIIADKAENASATSASSIKSTAESLYNRSLIVQTSINDILLNKEDAFDTFKELFDITKGNMTDVQASLDALRINLIDKANAKVNKEQNVVDTISYIDTDGSGKTYNLVITEGEFTLVEV